MSARVVSDPLPTLYAMPASQTPDGVHLMKPGEVQRLLRIGRTTLYRWRTDGVLTAVQNNGRGPFLYPACQPVLQAALQAAGGRS